MPHMGLNCPQPFWKERDAWTASPTIATKPTQVGFASIVDGVQRRSGTSLVHYAPVYAGKPETTDADGSLELHILIWEHW